MYYVPCSAGDGFASVVERHRRSVTSAAYQITQNIEDAHDVAQHVFLQMFCKQVLFRDSRAVRRWLYVVTRNEALNVQRRRKRDEIAADVSREDSAQLGPEDTVLRNEHSRQVRATVALLPSTDRRVIELRYLEALSTTEIALALGTSVGRVKRDIERAKYRLRCEMLRRGVAEA